MAVLAGVLLRTAIGWRYSSSPWDAHFGDLGHWADAGDRILRGQLPYKDFFGVMYGPLLYLWSALWYRLFGADLHAVLLNLEIVSPILCLLLCWYVAARTLKSYWLQALFIGAVALSGLHHVFWSPAFRTWLPLTALALARRRPAAASFIAGLCVFVSPDTGLAACACCALLAPASAPACLAPSLALLLFSSGTLLSYVDHVRRLALLQNWMDGLPLPPLTLGSAAVYLGPFILVGALGLSSLAALFRARRKEDRLECLWDVSLSLFAGFYLRYVLARGDLFHLAYSLAPILLLWFRFAERLRSPRWSLAALPPLLLISSWARIGEWRHLRLAISEGPGLTEWRSEGVRAPKELVERLDGVAKALNSRLSYGDAVVSLPLPIYAHLLRVPSALPASIPDYLLDLDGGPEKAVEALDRSGVRWAVLDPRLSIPLPESDALLNGRGPWGKRLTWLSPADEAISRELRDYLAARFEVVEEIEGAYILRRRASPLPLLTETSLARLLTAEALVPGRAYGIPLAAPEADELRLRLPCRYFPGLSSLAKTFVRVDYRTEGGRTVAGVLPVPPAWLGRDLRIPIPHEKVVAVTLELLSPGMLNPAPYPVEGAELELVRY